MIGAAGNIGSALVPELIKRGHQGRVLIHSEKQRQKLEAFEAEVVVGDLMKPSSIEPITDDIDVVYH